MLVRNKGAEKITDKGITYREEYRCHGGQLKRMSLDEFTWRNYNLDLAEVARHNHETSMCI